MPEARMAKTRMAQTRPIVAASALAFSTALALAAETVAIDNVVLNIGPTVWRMPHVEIAGSTLPQAELAQLFTGDAAAIDARLAKFSASRAFIPSMSTETHNGGETERTNATGTTLENIVAGRVGLWRATNGESVVTAADGSTNRFAWDVVASKGLDLRQMLRMSLTTRGADEKLKPLLDEETVDKARMEDTAQGLVVTTGKLTLAGAKGRPFAFPWRNFSERLAKLDPEKDDPTILRDVIDVLTSVDVGKIEARDIAATGKGEPLDRPYSIKIGRIGAERVAGGAIGDASLENFSLAASDGGVMTIGRVNLRDAALMPALKEEGWPRLAHIETKHVSGDLPDPKTSEKSRVKFGVDNVEADFMNYVENLPSKFSARIDHALIDLAARGETETTAQFLALGYRTLDLSAQAAGEWREPTKEATIGPILIDGREMGAAHLTLGLGNVTSAVFSSMPIVSKAAMLAVSINTLDLTIEGGELVDRLLALEAKERGVAPEKARADYAKTAGEAVTELAGGGEKAKRIGAAVSAYIMKPGKLHVKLTAPRGASVLEMSTKKPGEIVESAEIEAVAER